MSDLRVALVNASESEGVYANFNRDVDADVVNYNVQDGEYPDLTAVDAAIVTGSRASVYWDEDWIHELKGWVATAVDNDLPLLGVCFGHQLVADVCGGTVVDRGDYEIGYHVIEQCDSTTSHDTGAPALFDGMPSTFTAFTTHSDEVADLPPDAECLARNEYSIQAFRVNQTVFGVQFHPEFDMATAADVVRGKSFTDERESRLLDEITEAEYEKALTAKRVFENFLAIVQTRRASNKHSPSASVDET